MASLRAPVHESVLRRLPHTPRSSARRFKLPTTPLPHSATRADPAAPQTPPSATPRSRARQRTPQSDRYIPARTAMDMDLSRYALSSHSANAAAQEPEPGTTPVQKEFMSVMRRELLAEEAGTPRRVLRFSEDSAASATGAIETSPDEPEIDFRSPRRTAARRGGGAGRGGTPARGGRHKPQREIPSAPVRILDAPELVNDYYLNLLSWGSNNVLAVALNQAVYLWHAATGHIDELMRCEEPDNYVTSVSWGEGSTIAVGDCYGEVSVFDGATLRQVRRMGGHSLRVGSLAWNGNVVSSGSRDSTIVNHDVRAADHRSGVLRGHQQEVCGLSWSPDGSTLASGGNGNLLCLWDAAASSSQQEAPAFRLTQHVAAVKALAWCPFARNVLASGGGTADRTIKFWNAGTGALLNSVDTGSQVCSLLWSQTEKELLSSHGFSQNQLCLWKYPTMTKMRELTGHTSRVLHMAASPDGSTVVSAAADETLRFWEVFASKKRAKKGVHSAPLMSGMMLR